MRLRALLRGLVLCASCSRSPAAAAPTKKPIGTLLDRRRRAVLAQPVHRRRRSRAASSSPRARSTSAACATANGNYTLKVKRYDNALSPRKALANIAARDRRRRGRDRRRRHRRRRRRGRSRTTAHVPIGITYDGGCGLVDLEQAAERLPDRADGSRHRVPPRRVHDPEGPEARAHPRRHDVRAAGRRRRSTMAFSRNPSRSRRSSRCRPATPTSRRRCCARGAPGATALLVWGQASTIAKVVIAARSAGWNVPDLRAAVGRGSASAPAARGPAEVARRADVRVGTHDRRARPRLLLRLRVEVRVRVRRAEGRRPHPRRPRRDRAAGLRDVLLRLRQRARAGAAASGATRICRRRSSR